jgi:Na+/H+ antiporter NhaD/arsenite permease-like protein
MEVVALKHVEGLPGSQMLPADGHAAAAASASCAAVLRVREPSFVGGLVHLPWEVVPFVLGMFILVEGLAGMGWLDLLGKSLGYVANLHLALALVVMGSVSIVLSNVMNNQPMTILMTKVMMGKGFLQAVASVKVQQAAAFAVVIGSNLGANFTLIGALAGIMWVSILKRQGAEGVSYLRFLQLMSPSGVCCTIVSLVILYAEFVVFGDI